MKADQRPSETTQLNLSPLVGDWINLQGHSRYIVRTTLRSQDTSLLIRSYGANTPEPIDWGEIEALPYVMGQALVANGFSTCYELDGVRVNLAANQKLGILVIYSYVSYHDGSGRIPHHTRDFFRRSL